MPGIPGLSRSQGNRLYERVIRGSGDVTGVTDTATFNSLLAAGYRVIARPGETFYFNAPFYLQDNSFVELYGATLNLVSGVLTNLYRNAAVIPTRSVANGVTVSGSAVVKSTTIAFAAGDVGKQVGVPGAAAGGSTWYGTVQSVGTSGGSTTATLDTTAEISLASGATINVFSTRNQNITMLGGSFVTPSLTLGTTYLTQFCSVLRRVDGLKIRDQEWTSGGPTGTGGRFVMSMGDIDGFDIDGTVFHGTAGDGVHMHGPVSNGWITKTRGTTGDDMVVLATEDYSVPLLFDTQGNVRRVHVRDITGNNTWNPYKLYDLGTTTGKFSFTDVDVDGIHGSSQHYGAVLLGQGGVSMTLNRVSVKNVTVATAAGYQSVYAAGVSHASNYHIDDPEWNSTGSAASGIVQLTDPRGPVRVSRPRMNNYPGNTGSNVGLWLHSNLGAFSGSGFGTGVDVDGMWASAGVGTAPQHFTGVYIDGGLAGTLPYLRIRGAQLDPTVDGYLVFAANAVAIPDLDVSDCRLSGLTALLRTAASGTGAIKLRVRDSTVAATNLASVQCPLTLELSNVAATTSGSVVDVVGANATPVRIVAHGFTQAGAGVGVTRDGSQAISVNGASFPVDAAILTPLDGDIVYNTNASFGPGAGMIIYRSAEAAWFRLGITADGLAMPFTAGNYYGPQGPSLSTGTFTQGLMRGGLLVVGRTCTLTEIGVEVTTIGGTGSVLRLGIYKVTPGASDSATLLLDAGTVDGTIVGWRAATISQAVNQGDKLILVMAQQGSPTPVSTVRVLSGKVGYFASSTALNVSQNANAGTTVSSVTGALPGSLTISATATIPNVLVKA